MSSRLRMGKGRHPAAGGAPAFPGDVVSGAAAWWGLRAYNATAAATGIAAVQLLDAALTHATDIHLLSNGILDLTDPFFSLRTPPYYVQILYDQTGNGLHLSGTSRPIFNLTGNGLTVPSMSFVAASALFIRLGSNAFTLGSLPITFNAVYRHTTSAVPQCILQTPSPSPMTLNSAGTPASAYMANGGGGFPQATAANGSWHTAQAIFTGTTGDTMNVDNSAINDISGPANAGTSVPTSSDIYVGSNPASDHFDGFIAEVGIWPSGFSPTQQSNMYSNQHIYYSVF